jgi:mannose-1-phosphate guanylyltransferase
MRERITPPWALILAGGDGARLRPLTMQVVGDARPKQSCLPIDDQTLLDRRRRRLDLLVRFDHQTIMVTRTHEPYYPTLSREMPPARLAVLVPGARHLAVLRVKGVEWSDWGHPRRVLASLGRARLRPTWLDRVQLAEAG